MKTSYQVGDRCKIDIDEGVIIEIVAMREAYRVRLDNGRTLEVDERLLKRVPPPRAMVEEVPR